MKNVSYQGKEKKRKLQQTTEIQTLVLLLPFKISFALSYHSQYVNIIFSSAKNIAFEIYILY